MSKKTKCFLLSAAFLALFFFLIALLLTVDRAPIGYDREEIGFSHLNAAFREAIGYHPFFIGATNASGILLLAEGLFFAFMGFRSLFKNRKFSLVEREYYFLASLYILMAAVYFVCLSSEINCRPVLLPGESAEASFPSSHVLLAVCIGASAIPIFRMIFKDKPKCRLVGETVSCTLLLFTVLGRTLSGVHWITDIFGGLLLGWGLVFAFFGCLTPKAER